METFIKTPNQKRPMPNGFSTEFYQNFKELVSICHKLFHKIEIVGPLPNYSYEFIVILMPKAHKNSDNKKELRTIYLLNTDPKNTQYITHKLNSKKQKSTMIK